MLIPCLYLVAETNHRFISSILLLLLLILLSYVMVFFEVLALSMAVVISVLLVIGLVALSISKFMGYFPENEAQA